MTDEIDERVAREIIAKFLESEMNAVHLATAIAQDELSEDDKLDLIKLLVSLALISGRHRAQTEDE